MPIPISPNAWVTHDFRNSTLNLSKLSPLFSSFGISFAFYNHKSENIRIVDLAFAVQDQRHPEAAVLTRER